MAQVTYRACGVPGDQTVPRAELLAATMAVQVKQDPEVQEYAADSLYVQRGDEQNGPPKVMDGPNGLMWADYFAAKEALGLSGRTVAKKTKAHDEENFLHGVMEQVCVFCI